jgi:hypothetical protein
MARIPSRTRQVWTVVYADQQEVGGLGIAHFDDEAEAIRFAHAHPLAAVNEEAVPRRIADRWTFTRWRPS